MRTATSVLCLVCGAVFAVPDAVKASEDKGRIPVEDKYHITDEERAACGTDALALCSATYPDEDKLLTCMKINRLSLSASCRPVFEAGIRRRHLN